MSVDNIDGAKLFLVEDDQGLASLVKEYFEMHGFHVTVEHHGEQAAQKILAAKPDIVVLDLMLPGKNGLDICRELRNHSQIPVLMLTALTDDVDQIVGLEVGADDYICKPVQPRLLLARVKAILRRFSANDAGAQSKSTQEIMQFGQLAINNSRQLVELAGQPLELTTSELALLTLLAEKAGQIVSRDELTNALRGFAYDGLDRTVDTLVSRLRKKLGDDGNHPQKIKTVWKKGYLFVADAWE